MSWLVENAVPTLGVSSALAVLSLVKQKEGRMDENLIAISTHSFK
jgi:hypothetical protein